MRSFIIVEYVQQFLGRGSCFTHYSIREQLRKGPFSIGLKRTGLSVIFSTIIAEKHRKQMFYHSPSTTSGAKKPPNL